MTGEIEALGQMATAGLAASQLDDGAARRGPRARGAVRRPIAEPRDPHDLAHGACANCGTVLTGAFCATCGQSAHVHRSVGHIVEEFLHGIWHFDSKAWRTLPRLVLRPGRLTRDYVYGRRAAYIAPLALFLFSVFLMFFVFGLIGGPDINGALNATGGTPVAEARSSVADARGEVADAQAELASGKADHDTTPAELAALGATLAADQAKLAAAEKALATAATDTRPPAARQPTTWQAQLAKAAASGDISIATGSATIDARLRDALKNPDFALYRIEQKAYKLSFLLIPMSLPVLWLLFAFRRDVHTYDHVVFALYSLSFMSLLVVAVALVGMIDPTGGTRVRGTDTYNATGLGGLLIFAAPVHLFAQLKGAYRLSVGGALWRTAVLGIACCTILGLFAALIVVVGLAD